MLKQRKTYDCGHVCVQHHTGVRPHIGRPLNTDDISGYFDRTAILHVPSNFKRQGIYLLRAKSGTMFHWVSCKDNQVLDPATGRLMSPGEAVEVLCSKHAIVMCIEVKNGGKNRSSRRPIPGWSS